MRASEILRKLKIREYLEGVDKTISTEGEDALEIEDMILVTQLAQIELLEDILQAIKNQGGQPAEPKTDGKIPTDLVRGPDKMAEFEQRMKPISS